MKKPILPTHPVATVEPEPSIDCQETIYFYDHFGKHQVAGDYYIPVEKLKKFIEENKDKKNLKLCIESSEYSPPDVSFTYQGKFPNSRYTSEHKKWEKDRKNYWEVRMPKYEKLKAKYDKDFKKWDRWQKDQEFKALEKEYKKALRDKEARLSK